MSARVRHAATSGTDAPEATARAFRQVHGRRLHGFALLVTLGDAPLAARAADEALTAGAPLAATRLAHPERAAAWLRARVLGRVRGKVHRDSGLELRRIRSLESLGVDRAAMAGLARLGVRERAALVTSTVERLDPRDVATVVGSEGTRLERLVRRARRKAARAAAATLAEPMPVDGPLVSTIRTIAERTLR